MHKSAIWCVVLVVVSGGCAPESGTAPEQQQKTPEVITSPAHGMTPATEQQLRSTLATA